MIIEDKTTHALTSHIVFNIKRNETGNTKKFMARVVAGGRWRVNQRDYDTVYTPVVSFTLCVLTMFLTCTLGWFCKHVDATAAFLNGEIDKVNYSISLQQAKSQPYGDYLSAPQSVIWVEPSTTSMVPKTTT